MEGVVVVAAILSGLYWLVLLAFVVLIYFKQPADQVRPFCRFIPEDRLQAELQSLQREKRCVTVCKATGDGYVFVSGF